jgi:hypothetical protein
MKINRIRNKKSQIGATLTWIVALFMIVFVMAIYLTGVIAISKAKDDGITRAIKNLFKNDKEQYIANDKIIFTKSLISFLNQPVGNAKLYEVLSKVGNEDGKEDERQKIFKEKAEEFLKENFGDRGYYAQLTLLKWTKSHDSDKETANYISKEYTAKNLDIDPSMIAEKNNNFGININIYPNKAIGLSVIKI